MVSVIILNNCHPGSVAIPEEMPAERKETLIYMEFPWPGVNSSFSPATSHSVLLLSFLFLFICVYRVCVYVCTHVTHVLHVSMCMHTYNSGRDVHRGQRGSDYILASR